MPMPPVETSASSTTDYTGLPSIEADIDQALREAFADCNTSEETKQRAKEVAQWVINKINEFRRDRKEEIRSLAVESSSDVLVANTAEDGQDEPKIAM